MTVIIAEDTPPAVRGLLKRWFIEPRANIFVGTVNRRIRQKLIEFVRKHRDQWQALLIHSDPNCQGFVIEHLGEPARQMVQVSGLQLIAEKLFDKAPKKDDSSLPPETLESLLDEIENLDLNSQNPEESSF
jgi:CRISPR-associated protein Cas2